MLPAITYLNLGNWPLQAESSVNVMVGGDYDAGVGAFEAEGVVLVGGDASFDTAAHYSVGVAGAGSRVAPPALSDMLVVGGDVTVGAGTTVDVGSGIGGNVLSHGVVVPQSSVSTSGGSITENVVAPLDPYAGVLADYRDLSAVYAAMEPTAGATVAVDDHNVVFTGNGSTDRQVFEVPAGVDLGAIGATKTLVYDNIPVGTVIVVNVLGATATVSANSFVYDGVAVNPMSATDPLFSTVTQSMLWNFPEATTVTLGDEDQLPGSVLVPRTDSTTNVLTSTNGRFYAAGDVVTSGRVGAGLEFHSYPFRETSCGTSTPDVGSISITKTISDPDAVAAGRDFTGTYECVSAADTVVASGAWTLAADASVTYTGIAAGAVCTVTEDTPAAPSATDASYSWAVPVITGATPVVADAVVNFTVQNEVRRGVGDLEMVKVLDDPYDVVDLTRYYSGSFACTYDSVDITPTPGTWREQAGAAPVRLATGLPTGTVCTLTEDPILQPPLAGFPQYQWAAPEITPATVTIVENSVSLITVKNIVVDPTDSADLPVVVDPPVVLDPPVDVVPVVTPPPAVVAQVTASAAGDPVMLGALASTGADTAGPLLVAGFMIAIGLVVLAVRGARRRQQRDRG